MHVAEFLWSWPLSSLLLCSFGLLLLLPTAGTQLTTVQELYVKPTEDTSCPEPCYTLDEYVQNATQYFVSNTAFCFLPGTHNLSQSLNVSGVTNLALMSINGTANISFHFNIVFTFTSVSNLTMEGLTILTISTSEVTPLTLSNVVNLRLVRLCMQSCGSMQFNNPILQASNIFGTSVIDKFCLIRPLVNISNSLIKVQYTNPDDHVSMIVPVSLKIKNTSFILQHIDYFNQLQPALDLELQQSTYRVDVQVENVTMTIASFHIKIESTATNNIRITNSRFNNSLISIEEGESSYNIISFVRIENCQLQLQILQILQMEVLDGMFVRNLQSVHVIFENSVVTESNISRYANYIGSALRVEQVHSPFIVRNVTFFYNNMNIESLIQVTNVSELSFIDCRFCQSRTKYIPLSQSVMGGTILVYNSGNVTFTSCEFSDNEETPITAYDSTLFLSGRNVFSNNSAHRGGALALYRSFIFLSSNSNTVFLNNSAETVGGAIYIDNCKRYALKHPLNCFFLGYTDTANFTFTNNTATVAGSAIYGASFDTCRVYVDYIGSAFISELFHLDPYNNGSDFSVISSDPLRACLCNREGTPLCTEVFCNLYHYPGEPFQLSAVIGGDRFGTINGSVFAQLLPLANNREVASLGELQYSQQVGHRECTNLTYTIYSNSSAVTLVLTSSATVVNRYPSSEEVTEINNDIFNYSAEGTIGLLLQTFPVFINITLLPCPLGFVLSGEPPRCNCDAQLQSNNIPCNLTTQTVQRSGTVWVNASFHNNSYDGVIVNKYCPHNYCRSETVAVNLEHPDTQCTLNHSGILCGGCQSGLSLSLGSPRCLSCSNEYLSLLIPFVLAGFALVFFIKVLNMTVATGTLNGLIFYANIVKANQDTWLPSNSTNILTIFIAWLNLDLGIETCFFDGLDAYWKTWLQFIFPLYIWGLVVVIIILSRYSSTAAKVFGGNSVPVLATLFLFSYAKFLRTIISILQLSVLEYPHGTKVAVWSYDGNISYLSPIHIPLFLVALAVLLLLWLPYTGVLFFAQCLQKTTKYKVVRLLVRLKPFFDAYFGPLKDKHRYWVGLLLLIRGALYIVFAATRTRWSNIDLLVTLAVVLSLLTYLAYVGLVYRKYYLSLLENSFFLNLGVLAAGTLYIRASGGNQAALAYTSVGISFAQFAVIVLIHVVYLLKGTRVVQWLVGIYYQYFQAPQQVVQPNRDEYEQLEDEQAVNREAVGELLISYGDYREPVFKYLDRHT